MRLQGRPEFGDRPGADNLKHSHRWVVGVLPVVLDYGPKHVTTPSLWRILWIHTERGDSSRVSSAGLHVPICLGGGSIGRGVGDPHRHLAGKRSEPVTEVRIDDDGDRVGSSGHADARCLSQCWSQPNEMRISCRPSGRRAHKPSFLTALKELAARAEIRASPACRLHARVRRQRLGCRRLRTRPRSGLERSGRIQLPAQAPPSDPANAQTP